MQYIFYIIYISYIYIYTSIIYIYIYIYIYNFNICYISNKPFVGRTFFVSFYFELLLL